MVKYMKQQKAFTLFFIMILIVATIPLILQNPTQNMKVKAERPLPLIRPHVNVSIFPDSAKLYPGETETFVAVTHNGTHPFTYRWEVNGTKANCSQPSFEFGFEQPASFVVLSVEVADGQGIEGYASVLVYDPAFTSIPKYIDTSMPFSYLIEQNTTHSIAYNGSTWKADYGPSTNATYIVDSCIVEDTTLFFKDGTYPIDYRVTIDVHGINFKAENTRGVIFDMGANGEFWFTHATVSLEHYLFEGIHFDGTHATKPAINFYGMASNKRVGNADFYDCTFQYWALNQTTLTNYALNITNFDYISFVGCGFMNAPIRWATHGWSSSNSFITDSFIGVNNWDYNVSGIYLVTIEGGGLELRGNQFYAKSEVTGSQPIYGIHLKSSSLSHARIESYSERGEYVDYLRADGYSSTYLVRDTLIQGGRFVQSRDNHIMIYFDSNSSRSTIDNCLFSCSGSNTTAIWIDSVSTAGSGFKVSNNRIVAGTTFINGNGLPDLNDNIGYNTVGNITDAFTTWSAYKILDWGGNLTLPENGRTYTNYHSPKDIYIMNGTVYSVYVNNQLLFGQTNCTVHVGYADTFKMGYYWQDPPQIIVMGQ